jgi:hypothetical protein
MYVTNYALVSGGTIFPNVRTYQTVLRLVYPFLLLRVHVCVCVSQTSLRTQYVLFFLICSATHEVCIISTYCKILSHVT